MRVSHNHRKSAEVEGEDEGARVAGEGDGRWRRLVRGWGDGQSCLDVNRCDFQSLWKSLYFANYSSLLILLTFVHSLDGAFVGCSKGSPARYADTRQLSLSALRRRAPASGRSVERMLMGVKRDGEQG